MNYIYDEICEKYLNIYRNFKKELNNLSSKPIEKNQELLLRMKIHKRIGQVSKSMSQINNIVSFQILVYFSQFLIPVF